MLLTVGQKIRSGTCTSHKGKQILPAEVLGFFLSRRTQKQLIIGQVYNTMLLYEMGINVNRVNKGNFTSLPLNIAKSVPTTLFTYNLYTPRQNVFTWL